MTADATVSFRRSRGVRAVAIGGLLAAAVVMTRGSDDALLTALATGAFAVAALATWWAWIVPLAKFEPPLLVWRELPQRAPIEIDTGQIKTWRQLARVHALELELHDGQKLTLDLNAMARDDVPRLLDLLKFLRPPPTADPPGSAPPI